MLQYVIILFETASFSEVLLFLINYFDTKLLLLLVLHAHTNGIDLSEVSCSSHSYKCHFHRANLKLLALNLQGKLGASNMVKTFRA